MALSGFSPGGRSRFLVPLLLLTLGLAGALAYEAYKAARSHHAAATSALQDHAAFVAWQYADRAQSKLDHTIISPGFFYVLALEGESARAAFPALDGSEPKPVYTDKPPPHLRYAFQLDLATRKLVFCSGERPSARVASWIADTLSFAAREIYRTQWAHATAVGAPDGRSHIIYYKVGYDRWGAPKDVRGFEVDVAALHEPLGYAFDYPLLPPSLTGGVPNADVLSVRVFGPAGDTLFATRPTYVSGLTARDSLPLRYGGLPIEVALRPESAEALIIGGLPDSRLPLLAGLLLLTGGLIAAAIFLLRREVEFARLRSEFVSNVSHELRTPLAQIRMFAETLLLERVRSEGERERGLAIIDQEARRLSNLVGNILLFSRAERNGMRLNIQPTRLAPLVEEVLDAFRPLAASRDVRVVTDLDPDLIAPLDASAVRQILINFLDNAVKYGPAGQVIRVGAKPLIPGRARVWVEDEGPGIPPEDREAVWEPFSRLEREREKATAGTGIGLSVVRDLAERHGGRAWVEGAATGGCRFVLELPRARRSYRSEQSGNGAEAASDHEPAVPDLEAAEQLAVPPDHAPDAAAWTDR